MTASNPVTVKASAVDVANVRIVDRHYRFGWFRVDSGKTVRMYRADGKRLVLLPMNLEKAVGLWVAGEVAVSPNG
jgi:hypothetical protein